MNLILWKVAFVVALMLSAGCAAYTASLQSSFFSKFALRELVERNKSRDLNCSAGGGGGSVSRFGRKESHFQKGENLSCQITEQFDEEEFLQALKQSIEMDLERSNARIIGIAKIDAQSFYCEYAFEDIRGRVEISGRMVPGNYYSLKADLDEKQSEAK